MNPEASKHSRNVRNRCNRARLIQARAAKANGGHRMTHYTISKGNEVLALHEGRWQFVDGHDEAAANCEIMGARHALRLWGKVAPSGITLRTWTLRSHDNEGRTYVQQMIRATDDLNGPSADDCVPSLSAGRRDRSRRARALAALAV